MKILIQKFDDKFIRNMCDSLNTLSVNYPNVVLDINNNLYENYYSHKFSTFLFTECLINPEVEQFIEEFSSDLSIIIYHPNIPNIRLIEKFGTTTKNIVHQNIISIANTTIIPKLLNHKLFYSDKSISKKDEAICFLDKLEYLPDNLLKHLFPNKYPKKIKLFNNAKIPHYQNLGLLKESEKAKLLREYRYYIDINNDYNLEAQVSDCIVLGLDDLASNTIPEQNKTTEHSFVNFEDFIKTTLCLL